MKQPYRTRSADELATIAAGIISAAALIDRRISLPNDQQERAATIMMWSRILAKSDVFLSEGMDAVENHYSKPNAFPILPGDVVSHVKRMPITSSAERFRFRMEWWADYPFGTFKYKPTEQWTKVIYSNESYKSDYMKWLDENFETIYHNALNPPKELN